MMIAFVFRSLYALVSIFATGRLLLLLLLATDDVHDFTILPHAGCVFGSYELVTGDLR